MAFALCKPFLKEHTQRKIKVLGSKLNLFQVLLNCYEYYILVVHVAFVIIKERYSDESFYFNLF